MTVLAIGAALAWGWLGSAALAAQEAGGNAAPAKANAVQPRVTVVSIDGVASRQAADDPKAKWQPLRVGDVLDERTVIRTGFGAQVVLQLADRGLMTIGPSTKAGVETFGFQGRLLKARLSLRNGSMRVRVDDSFGPNDLSVSTPVAILSVRGCGADIAFTEKGLAFAVFEHKWHMRTLDGRERIVREGERTDGKLTPSDKLARQDRHVNVAGAGAGVTDEDRDSLMNNPGGRAILDFAAGDDGRWLMARTPGSGSPDVGETKLPPVTGPVNNGGITSDMAPTGPGYRAGAPQR